MVKQQLGMNNKEDLQACLVLTFILWGLLIILFFAVCKLCCKKGDLQDVLKKSYLSNPLFQHKKCTFNSSDILTPSSKSFNCDIELVKEILSYPQSRIVFLGKAGSGKTCFFHSILRKWAKGATLHNYTLIYFRLDDHTSKSDFSWEKLAKQVGTSIDCIKSSLSHKVILILDGVETSTLQTCLSKKIMSSLEGLLQENFVRCEHMKVWIGCREVNDIRTKLRARHESVIYFNERTNHQIKTIFTDLLSRRGGIFSPEHVWEIYNKCTEQNSVGTNSALPVTAWLLALICWYNGSKVVKEQEVIESIIKFCSHNVSHAKERNEAMTCLMNCDNWDLIACLLEAYTNNEQEFTKYVKMFGMRHIKFRYVDEDYPQQAILHLCKAMKEEGTVLESIQFRSLNPTFLIGNLPKVRQHMEFYNSHLEEQCFYSLMESVAEKSKNIHVKFYKSKLPQKVKKTINAADITVSQKKNDVIYSLDFSTGKWEKNVRRQ